MRARTYIYYIFNNYLMNITELNKLLKIYKNLINKKNFIFIIIFCRHQNFVRIKNRYIMGGYVPRLRGAGMMVSILGVCLY